MSNWATDEEDSSTSSDWTEYEDSTLSDQSNADFLATFQSLPFDFNGHFQFFELPPEIRDHVFSQVFETQIIDILPSENYSAELGRRYDASKLLGPIIWETLSVSRRFLREAILAFFSTSVFRFHDCGSFSGFIDSLPFTYRGAIRSLDFRLKLSTYQTGEDREQWQRPLEEKLLTQLNGLQHLNIELSSIGRKSVSRAESRICQLQATRPGSVRPLNIVISSPRTSGSEGPLSGNYEQTAPDYWQELVERWGQRYQ